MADDASTATADEAGRAPDAAAEEIEAPERDEANEALLATFTDAFGGEVIASHITRGTLWVRVGRDEWHAAALACRDRLRLTFFDFLSAIDWLPAPWGRYEDAEVDVAPALPPTAEGVELEAGHAGGDTRFQVFARFADVRSRAAVVLKADLPDDDLRVATISDVYAGANWHEREAWEMYGITFDGHPGLRHLYLPSGFEGFPLRKDFPLLARIVKPWPGIVDVEPMPADPAADAAEGEGAEGGEADATATDGGGEA